MDETHTSTWSEAEAIREWIERYEPRLLSPHQRTHLLPRLRELVLAGEFPTLSYARAAMSRAVRFISDMASPEVVDLGEVLSEVNVAAWSHGRPGCRTPSAQDVSSVRRLLAVAQGLRPRRETAAQAAEPLPVFTADEFGVLGTVTRSDADTRMLVAVVGAGVWGPEADGAYIDVVDGVPQVRLANGATREVDPALLEALPTVSAGRVQMEGWNNLTRRASRRGVKLTQYRARDAWAARMLSDALPAVQVIRNLGIHRETIAAVAPLLELPAPEETRGMLRGQPRGDWRHDRDRHLRPQPATSDAGSGGGTVSSRRPSRAEMQRRVRAARNAAAPAPVLTESLERILAGYEPEDCEPTVWEAVRPVVRQVMERSGTRTAEAFRKQLGVLVAYLRWRHSEGLDVQPSASMTFRAIDDFYRRVGDRFQQTTRNDYRSRLRRLAQAVNPGIDAPPTVTLGHRPVRVGYSEAEEATIRRVALRQRRPHIRRQLCLIVGLVMGAGIASQDLRHLRTQHVIDEGANGIRVEVPGDRPRTVWVRIDYEELVRVGLAGVLPGHLLVGKKADRKKVTGAVLEQADLYDFGDLDVARMRTTWLTWLMTQPVPLVVVLHAAGLETARTLTDLVRHIPVDEVDAAQFRGTPS